MVKPTVCQPDQLATGARFVDCVYGCLVNILFFPVKPVLGKLMLILRFRRSVEMAGRNYHTFRLTDYALRAGWVAPAGPWSAAQMRDAIERVCDQSDISPVSAAFRQVLSKRSGALKDTAKLFWKSLRSVAGRRDEKEVQQAVETAQQEAE